MRRTLTPLLVSLMLVMAFACTCVSAAYTDTTGHWAQDTINQWEAQKLISGYEDGAFRPNAAITRAEVSKLLASLLNLSGGSAEFADVPQDAWYYPSMAACYANGYMLGDGNGVMRPDSNITRQEFFVIAARVYQLSTDSAVAPAFTDGSSVASWAVGAVNALSQAGRLSGYPDGTLKPGATISRAETITVLDSKRADLAASSDEGSNENTSSTLTALKLVDSAHLVDFKFDPSVKEYNVEVFEDVYGVQFIPTLSEGGSVKVTFSGDSRIQNVSKTAVTEGATAELLFSNAYDEKNLPEAITVSSGEILALGMDENREANIAGGTPMRGMEDDCDYTVTFTDGAGTAYTINIHRPGAYKLVEKFVKREGAAPAEARGYSDYTLYQPLEGKTENGNPRFMPYCLYLPENYSADKSYPVLIVPHGAGQFMNASDDLLLRTAQASAFVHYGKEVILIVPQGNDQTIQKKYTVWNSGKTDDNPLKLGEFGEATMQILFDLEKDDNPYGIRVDKNRIYVAGGSMGGAGASAFLSTYPDVFAAGIITCPYNLVDEAQSAYLAKAVSENNIAVTLVHSKGDGGAGGVPFENSQAIVDAFKAVGYTNYRTAFYEADHYGLLTGEGEKGPYDADDYYLWPTAHFSWVPFFDNEANQDWLLSQSK